MRVADDGFGLGFLEQEFHAAGEFAHDLGLVRHHGRQIEFDRGLDAELGKFADGFIVKVAGMQQRLGRDAAYVQAGAAERTALVDTGGCQAQLARANGGVVTAGTAANDDDVE